MEEYSIDGSVEDCMSYITEEVRKLAKNTQCVALDDESVKDIIINFNSEEWKAKKEVKPVVVEEKIEAPKKVVKQPKVEFEGEQLCLF